MSSVRLKGVKKCYGAAEVVCDVNFEVAKNEFVVLLGPSGCGKSTVLRMIAGLESISGGEIAIGDEVVNNVRAKNRDVAMVFQNYALFPHMTVRQNISFGLKLAKTPKAEITRKVEDTARILELSEYLDRKPSQLSGGQRQRVAMGRAMVRKPAVFLFDEPLSNLDAKLRAHMRLELKKLHKKLKTTTIYVTHDQVEAMTLASRVVILRNGAVEQIGTPREVYAHPANLFVAGFIGNPSMNLQPMRVERDGEIFLTSGPLRIPAPEGTSLPEGGEVVVGLRPHDIHLAGPENAFPESWTFDAEVEMSEMLGAETMLDTLIGGAPFQALVSGDEELNGAVRLSMNLNKMHVFDAETGAALR